MRLDKLKILNIVFKIVGMSPLLSKNHSHLQLRIIYQVIMLICTVLFVIAQVLYLCTHITETEAFAQVIACAFSLTMAAIKLSCYIAYRDQFTDIVDKLILEDYVTKIRLVSHMIEQTSLGPKSTELLTMMEDTHDKLFKLVDILVKIYASLCYVIPLMLALQTILDIISYKDYYHRELPIGVLLPWETHCALNYELTFIAEYIIAFFNNNVHTSIDSAFYLLTGELTRHVKILGFILENLSELVSEVDEMHTEEWERDCNIVLADCAQHYTSLRRLTETLNIIYWPNFLIQTTSTSIIMCMCIFRTLSTKSIVEAMPYCVFNLSLLTQILLYASVVQSLINQSEKLKNCLMHNWWLHGRRYRINARILQDYLQQTLTMYIWGSIEYSNSTVETVVRASMSYLALLRSRADEN